MRRITFRLRSFLGLLLALSMVLAACSGGDASEAFQEIASGLGGESTEATFFEADGGEATLDRGSENQSATSEEPVDDGQAFGRSGSTPVALPTNIGRDIIFTADLVVAVEDVASAGETATRAIQGLGGFLFGQSTSGSPQPTSVLTFKVQPGDFQEALARLGELGELRSQHVSANDVTERIVDLESRIATATASVDRLRGLLAEASDIKAIVELESELLARETELETLRGSLRTLQDQVSLATIVMTLTQAESNPHLEVTTSVYPGHDEGVSCPGDSSVSVESDTEATVCFEIMNQGDTWLTDFELRDPVLDIDLADMTVVFGDLDTALEPGASILLAYEVTPERTLRTRTTITAEPVSEDGSPLSARTESRTVGTVITAVDPGGIPSFTEGIAASWDLLVRVAQGAVLLLGLLIPFVWLPVAGWFLWRWWTSRPKVEGSPET